MRACGPRHTLSCTLLGTKDGGAVCMSLHCPHCGGSVSMVGDNCRKKKLIFAKLLTVAELSARLHVSTKSNERRETPLV